jgi:hypothetical protein
MRPNDERLSFPLSVQAMWTAPVREELRRRVLERLKDHNIAIFAGGRGIGVSYQVYGRRLHVFWALVLRISLERYLKSRRFTLAGVQRGVETFKHNEYKYGCKAGVDGGMPK